MSATERALLINCGGERMLGVLHAPARPRPRGVLIVVGGPQYRVGSHRQFLLLARHLASDGIPVLRFDYRGMGDSDGRARDFEHVDSDIHAAIDDFFKCQPGLKDVVIWGLCDAASAALMYAHSDPRVSGTIALNPWVRSDTTLARTVLRHHYSARLTDSDFWRRLLTGRINLLRALAGLFDTVRSAGAPEGSPDGDTAPPFVIRMRDGLAAFRGRVLFILSGDDLTAAEFCDEVERSPQWTALLQADRVQRIDLAPANHTFSRRVWRDEVATRTADWVLER